MDTEVLVVGAGPAGLAAARAASRVAGVTLLDDNPRPGGQIWRNRSGLNLPAGVQWLPSSGVAGLMDHDTLLVDGRPLRFQKLILATGAREVMLPFPDWTLPGVVGAGGLQAMIKGGLDVQGKRVVVAGSGPLLLAVAQLAHQKGARVLHILEQASREQVGAFLASLGPAKLFQAASLGPALLSHYTTDAYVLQASGQERLQRVTFQVRGRLHTVDCDVLAVGFGLVPNLELALDMGCRLDQGFIQVDDTCQTTIPKVFAAGEVTGIGGLEKALLEGEVAGLAATGQKVQNLGPRLQQMHRFVRKLRSCFAPRPELLTLATPETLVCRCEDVQLGQLQNHSDWRSAKLHTRLGMGACQGRTCGPICQSLLGYSLPQTRPPVFATRLKHLILEEQP